MRKSLLTAALLLLTTLSFANDGERWLGVWDSDARHSASLSVGLVPFMWVYYTSQRFVAWDEILFEEDHPAYSDYCMGESSSMPVISASYFYRVGRVFSVGCSIGYGHESTEILINSSDEYAFTTRDNVLLISPTLRLHWLNTKHVELYSGMALLSYGVCVSTNAYHVEGSREVIEGLSMQFTPLAISAKFDHTYIFSELGLGTLGTLRFGVGYRF